MKMLGKTSAYANIIAFMKEEKALVDLTDHEKELVIRWQEAFTLMRQHKSTADAAAILMKRFEGLSRASAYRACADAISLFGDISKSSKEGIRHLTTEMIRDAYRIAFAKNDVDGMIKASTAIAKINGVNITDPEQFDWSELEPHTYELSLDDQMLRALRSMIKGGRIDLTAVVDVMNNQAEDAVIIDDKDEGNAGS